MSSTPSRVRGTHVLFALLAFFGAVIAVNVAFVVFALRSFPGEDVRRSYLQGLDYNATLAERREQATRGWNAAAALSRRDGAAVVEVTVRDRSGRPIDGLTTMGELRWPANERFDHALAFVARGQGRYVARIDGLSPGRWILRARAEQTSGPALDFEAELTWPS